MSDPSSGAPSSGPPPPGAPPPGAPPPLDPEDERWAAAERAVLAAAARDLERDVERARRDRDAAITALRRMRTRRSMRVARAVDDRLRAGLEPVRALRRRVSPPPTLIGGSSGAQLRVPAGLPTPAAFRRSFLEKLDRPGELWVAILGPDPAGSGSPAEIAAARPAAIAAALPAAFAAAGWTLVADPGRADVTFVADPSRDLRGLPRGPVLVAVVADPVQWVDRSWLDDVDLVVVPDESVATALEGGVAVTAQKVAAIGAEKPSGVAPTVRWPDGTADGLEAALRHWAHGLRIGIAIGIPSWDVAEAWGDLHFARALQRQLERRGHATRVHLLPDWTDRVSARDDVVIHIFGLSERAVLPGQRTILWVISHPDRVSAAMLAGAERIYVASDRTAERIASQTDKPVTALHQATDPERFRLDPTGPEHGVLFVGNTRGVRRRIVEDLVPTTLDLAVYGQGWSRQFPDAPFIRGEHVPNAELNRWYGSAGVVLNDHWPDMQAEGFLSNRLYDALAAGGFVISDAVEGMDEEFDGGVVSVSSAGELRWAIHDHLADPDRRRRLAERGRRAVLERHTFAHRIDTILADLAADLATSPTASRAIEPHAENP